MQAQERKKTYDNIIKLYDFAEELVVAIEKNPANKPKERLMLVEHLIEQIEESAETLAQVYISFMENGAEPDEESKQSVEKALRKIFQAISKFKQELKKL